MEITNIEIMIDKPKFYTELKDQYGKLIIEDFNISHVAGKMFLHQYDNIKSVKNFVNKYNVLYISKDKLKDNIKNTKSLFILYDKEINCYILTNKYYYGFNKKDLIDFHINKTYKFK